MSAGTKVYIKQIEYYLPSGTITNEDLNAIFPEWSSEKIGQKVGIKQRHVATQLETATDLGIAAAEKLFRNSSIDRNEIDFLLFCTQSPDYALPTSACIVQNRLGLRKSCGALDYNLGCSAFVYGLALAKGLLISGACKNILLITSETYSKFIDSNDKGNRSIFGDGAAATIVSTEGFAEIGEFVFGTDGSGYDRLIVPNSGARKDEAAGNRLFMDGAAIFNFTIDAVPKLLSSVLEKNHVSKESISLYLLHQANSFMLETLRKICQIPPTAFYNDIQDIGNTVSSTIPIALSRLSSEQKLPVGNLLIAGFGVGYSWAGTIIKTL